MPDIDLVLFTMLLVFGLIPLLGIFIVFGAAAMTFIEFLDWTDKKIASVKTKGFQHGKRK